MCLTLLDVRLRRERPGDRYASAVTDFRKSSFCGTAACVEVEIDGDDVLVRDSKNVVDPFLALRFDAEEWRAFVAGVKDGQFDI